MRKFIRPFAFEPKRVDVHADDLIVGVNDSSRCCLDGHANWFIDRDGEEDVVNGECS